MNGVFTGTELAALEGPALVSLLERVFARDEPDGPSSHGLSDALWERALRGPLRDFLSRPGKELRARLVELGFALAGRNNQVIPAALPWVVELLHAGSLIVDDIQDDSEQRRGRPALHRLHGMPVALNAGNWLYFLAQHLLASMPLGRDARLLAHERIAECLLRCHEGQALDLTVRVEALPAADVPAVVRTLTTLKTGKLVELSLALGAIAGAASEERVQALARFGRDVGVGLQMLDDLSGVLNPSRRDKALEDLRFGRATWVWAALAEELEAGDYAALIAQLKRAQQGEQADEFDEYEPILAQARFRLGMTGLRRVRRHVDAALEALEQAIGSGRWLHAVRDELAALERRFMEAA
jgi:geranylgeranyl pyrophosphate synthase